MSDAAHLRVQAELCFAIADLMSDPADAKTARLAAEQYVWRAEKAEERAATQSGKKARASTESGFRGRRFGSRGA